MKYKISESPLLLREFGRNIQSLIEYAKKIEDRDLRTQVAHEIVRIMSNLNPSVRELQDYKQKLWDYLFIISDYDFDVDSPYPPPERTVKEAKPERMEYYRARPRYRQYGRNVELMIQKAAAMEEGPARTALINFIATTMKMFLQTLDRGEGITDDVIAGHITELSGGKIRVKGDDITISKIHITQPVPKSQTQSRSKRSRKNRRRKGN